MTTGTQFPWNGAGSEPKGKSKKTSPSPKSGKGKSMPHPLSSNGLMSRLQSAAGNPKPKRGRGC
jgi:hypothetical protein